MTSITQPSAITRRLLQLAVDRVYPLLDDAPDAEQQAFPAGYAMVPYTDSKRVGWTHYGVMIPDLPAPFRFFSIMSIIGMPGALAFDTDHALADSPRRTATVVSGTAVAAHFDGYSIERDCQMSADGRLVQFGNEVKISGQYPDYKIHACYNGLEVKLTLKNTDKVSWFVKNAVYDHLSLLTEYQGTLSWQGEVTEVAGLCTFEYASCPSPYLLRDKPIPSQFKLPLDSFIYNIINLDDHTQLLLSHVSMKGVDLLATAYVRSLDSYSQSYDAHCEVLTYQEQLAIAPDGNRMRLPQTLQWTIEEGGQVLGIITGEIDTPFSYGLGSGYVGGYHYSGQFRGQPISGRGYIEYIDRK